MKRGREEMVGGKVWERERRFTYNAACERSLDSQFECEWMESLDQPY